MRKTKIICTIGPSSENEETLTQMCLAGMNVARLNFSSRGCASTLVSVAIRIRMAQVALLSQQCFVIVVIFILLQ